jgi:hypothetical protein
MDAVYIAGSGGPGGATLVKHDMDGSLLGMAHVVSGSGATNGYLDEGGVHFALANYCAFFWSGEGAAQPEGECPLGSGALATGIARQSMQIGRTALGEQWIVRAVRHSETDAPIMLRIRNPPAEGPDVPISDAGAVAFVPAAAMDSLGRLHVMWYESQRERGQLRYTRSRSANLSSGFEPSVVIDDDAVPGAGWYPSISEDSNVEGRRLREYVDLAVSGNRVHLAWTHAPTAPSRVYTAFVEWPGQM